MNEERYKETINKQKGRIQELEARVKHLEYDQEQKWNEERQYKNKFREFLLDVLRD